MALAEPTRLLRHTRRNPCPVCGGGDDDPRGQSIRCDGFTAADGRYAHCSREEHAGVLSPERNGRTYAHRLDGRCACGLAHANGATSSRTDGRRAQPEPAPLRAYLYERIPETVIKGDLEYQQTRIDPYPHAAGEPWAHEVRRYDLPDGSDKTYRPYSRRADGLWVMAHDGGPGAIPWPIYNLPAVHAAPSDTPLLWVEGEKCAKAAQSALQAVGVAWVVTTTRGGDVQVASLPAVMFTPTAGRTIVVLRDNDGPGEHYASIIAERARAAGARRVEIVQLDGLPIHGDVADWLAAGHTGAELAQLVQTALATPAADVSPQRDTSSVASETPDADDMYRATPGGLRRIKREVDQAGQQKETLIPLTNFNARIVSDTLEDDGVETRRTFDIEATLCVGDLARRTPRQFSVLAERFNAMNWPTEHLGATAIVHPGQSSREHARVAIQMLSGIVPERRVFTHTGWRQVDGEWVYLHAGGAIGANGVHTDVSVALSGDLARYELPTLPEMDTHAHREIVEATRASLRMLDVAPIVVTAPMFAATYRAPLGNTDFAVHVGGQTGEGKSELAALAQQHYGPTMDARHLPASWSSTGNALEAQAFHAKDALLVVDDFIPTGTTMDAQRLHGVAERVLRAQGNHSGRQRLHADTSQRQTKPPRGLILSTGEDTPRGTSLRARMLVVEHAPGTMDWRKLSTCQRDAACGRYALAMAAYIRWVAARYADIQAELRPQAIREALADRLGQRSAHKRTSDNVAQLIAAVAIFTRYACEIEALTAAEAEELYARVTQALLQVGEQQATLQAQGDPVTRFLTLLNAAITSGDAHLADKRGEHPGDADTPWGWRLQTRGAGENMTVEWVSLGRKVGWLDGEDLYLEPDAAFAAAHRIGQATGDTLTVTAGTLWKRCKERGYLLSRDETRETLKIRVKLEGRSQNVLHLDVSALTSLLPHTNPTNPAHHPDGAPVGEEQPGGASTDTFACRVSASGFGAEFDDPTTNPTRARAGNTGAGEARVGLVVGLPAQERGLNVDAQRPSDKQLSDGARSSAGKPTQKTDTITQPDKRSEVLALAERLGWPDLWVGHLHIPNERAWRSVARGSEADVERAYHALTTAMTRHAEAAGGANHARH